jgi:hypothetical protein
MSQQPVYFVSTNLSPKLVPKKDQTYTKDSDTANDSGVLGRGKSVIGGANNTLGSTAAGSSNINTLRGSHCDNMKIGYLR